MSVLIKNGIIGTAAGSFRGDLLIEGEKIAAVGESIHCAGAEIIDAAGRYVVPGGVDPHTHVMLHVGKNKVSDGFEAATKAALCGGTTTIAEHPAFAADGAPLASAPDDTLKEAESGSWCDFGVHLVFQRWDAAISEELSDAVANGFATGKVYTTYSGRLCDEDILPLMKRMKECGGLLFYHCENNAVAAGLQADFRAAGQTAAEFWPLSRPDYCEAEAINRVLALAKAADAPVYIVHLSTKAGLKVIVEARKTGQKVFAETCPQYLLLTDKLYKAANGLDYIMAPPLRSQTDCEALWKALGNGDIDTVGTDHCSFSRRDKIRHGKRDVFKSPSGIPGIETRMPLLFSEGVLRNRISLEQFVSLTATAPARILGFADKGRLEAGADADVVIIDPDAQKKLTVRTLHQLVDYTPFENMTVHGWPEYVWLRGRAVIAKGRFAARKPRGMFVKRKIEAPAR